MRLTPHFLLLLALLGALGRVLSAAPLPPLHPAVQVYAEDTGLPSLALQTLIQDAEGGVWVGTQQGVARFLGGRFQPVPAPPVFQRALVVSMVSTPQGLYLGTATDGVLRLSAGVWSRLQPAEGPPLHRVLQCVQGPGGEVLVLTVDRPVLRVEGDRLVPQPDMPPAPLSSLVHSGSGWIGGSLRGLWRKIHGVWALDPELPDPVMALGRLGETLLVSSARRTCLGKPGAWRELPELRGQALRAVAVGPGLDGGPAFWGITRRQLYCLEGSAVRAVPLVPAHETPPLLQHVALTSVMGRSQVWVSSVSGLYRLAPGGWNRLDPEDGPGSSAAFGMTRDAAGHLWVGDALGRIHRLTGGTWRTWPLDQEHGTSVVKGMCALPDGQILAILSFSGLWRWNGRQWIQEGWGEAPKGTDLSILVPGRFQGESGAWGGTEAGLFFWSPRRGFIRVASHPRPLRWVLMDPGEPGRVYTGGMSEEVLVLEGDHLRKVADLPGTRWTLAARWVQGQEGRQLRIASYTQGVVTLDLGTRQQTRWNQASIPGWPGDMILSLDIDAQGRTWAGTDSGLAVVAPGGHLLATYTRADGLPSDLCTNPSLVVTPATAWISTSRGVAFLPIPTFAGSALPPLRLTGLHTATGAFRPGARLPHPVRHLEVSFDLPLLHRESDIRYRTALEGSGAGPGLWTRDARVAFPTLPAGHYRLKVWARDGLGRVTGPLEIPFSVAPPLWRHPAMLTLYLMTVAGLVWALHRLRTASLQAHNHQLSEAVSRATEDLRATNERLYQLNDEKNRIIGVAAHDLRNPLNGILLSCQMMEEDLSGPPGPDLAHIRTLSQGMNALIQELLDVNAIEANTAEAPVLSPTQALPLLRDVHRSYLGRAQAKGILLHLEAPPEPQLDPILTDPRHLRRVLDNLVSNAVKYSPPGREVHLRLVPGPDALRFEIQDHGPGLTEADKAQVFGAYARLSARPTAGESSVGLGLSIVKKLVTTMGGRLGVDSVAGQGATFWVDMPRAAGVPPRKPES